MPAGSMLLLNYASAHLLEHAAWAGIKPSELPRPKFEPALLDKEYMAAM